MFQRAVAFTDLSLAASPTLLFNLCANMQIKLLSQVFLRPNGVVRKSSRSEELTLTLGA